LAGEQVIGRGEALNDIVVNSRCVGADD